MVSDMRTGTVIVTVNLYNQPWLPLGLTQDDIFPKGMGVHIDILCGAIQLNGKPRALVIVLVTAPVKCYVLVVRCHVSWLWPVKEDALLLS